MNFQQKAVQVGEQFLKKIQDTMKPGDTCVSGDLHVFIDYYSEVDFIPLYYTEEEAEVLIGTEEIL